MYELEACAVCGVVRLVMARVVPRCRLDAKVYIGETPIWPVDFCPSCWRDYEAQFAHDSTTEAAIEPPGMGLP